MHFSHSQMQPKILVNKRHVSHSTIKRVSFGARSLMGSPESSGFIMWHSCIWVRHVNPIQQQLNRFPLCFTFASRVVCFLGLLRLSDLCWCSQVKFVEAVRLKSEEKSVFPSLKSDVQGGDWKQLVYTLFIMPRKVKTVSIFSWNLHRYAHSCTHTHTHNSAATTV